MRITQPERAVVALIVIAVGILLTAVGKFLSLSSGAVPIGFFLTFTGILVLITSFATHRILSEDHLIVTNSGFSVGWYGGKAFSFSDVQHIKPPHILVTKVYYNLRYSHERNKVTVEINLLSSPTVLEVVGERKKAPENWLEKYEIIRRNSFQARAARYLTGQKDGYFTYDRVRIHRNSDVDHPRGKFNLISDKAGMRRRPFSIYCEKKIPFLRWLTRYTRFFIDTTVDADVFLHFGQVL